MQECILGKITQFITLFSKKDFQQLNASLSQGKTIIIIDDLVQLNVKYRSIESDTEQCSRLEVTASRKWPDRPAILSFQTFLSLMRRLNPLRTHAVLFNLFFDDSALFLSWKPLEIASAQECFKVFNLQKEILNSLIQIRGLA